MGTIYRNGTQYGGGGSGAGGHEIVDTDGSSLPAEDKLQFIGLDVTDNSTDGETEVESFGLNADSLDDVMSAGVAGNQVASNGLVYSTTEQVVGKWIDGKPLYQKTIDCGSLPNSSIKQVNHGISNLDKVVYIKGYTTEGTYFTDFPRGGYENNVYFCNIEVYPARIDITTKTDQRSRTAVVTLRYTKTTD